MFDCALSRPGKILFAIDCVVSGRAPGAWRSWKLQWRRMCVRPVPPQPEHEHLGEWLRQHQDMTFQQQERALRTEPGFNRLPAEKQQRLLARLQQLDAMPPARRERMLARLETWERLSPEQRQQVRAGILEVHQMPFDRQIMIHRAVRDLSEFPESQRGDILNSPEFRSHYSDYERQVLATLMMAQPYEPLRPQ